MFCQFDLGGNNTSSRQKENSKLRTALSNRTTLHILWRRKREREKEIEKEREREREKERER